MEDVIIISVCTAMGFVLLLFLRCCCWCCCKTRGNTPRDVERPGAQRGYVDRGITSYDWDAGSNRTSYGRHGDRNETTRPSYVAAVSRYPGTTRFAGAQTSQNLSGVRGITSNDSFTYASTHHPQPVQKGIKHGAAKHIDLHGMSRNQALQTVKNALDRARPGTTINFVTGRGLHSRGGIPVIKPVVENFLAMYKYRHEWKNAGGMVSVTK